MLKAPTDGQKKSVMSVTKNLGYNAVRTMTAPNARTPPSSGVTRVTGCRRASRGCVVDEPIRAEPTDTIKALARS